MSYKLLIRKTFLKSLKHPVSSLVHHEDSLSSQSDYSQPGNPNILISGL